MQPTQSGAVPISAAPSGPLKEITAAARGWNTIQMAVLGFCGICGTLRVASHTTPRAVQVLAAVLAVTALALACVAVFTVGRLALPVNVTTGDMGDGQSIAHAAARLNAGIRLTIVALILAVIAALSGWWPATTTAARTADTVTLTSSLTGQSVCGPLIPAPEGTISVQTADTIVTVPTRDIAQLRPVGRCP
jgi:hypothetical protein